MNDELVYWVALSQNPLWNTEKINQVIVKVIHEQKMDLSALFSMDEIDLKNKILLDEKDIYSLNNLKKELPKYSFLTEDLLSQGYEIITINSPKYSKTLKENLKMKNSPPLVYVKGNVQLMQEKSVAIVGSREADEISLNFTDNIAKTASKEFKVVVSGFAKGVDKQALDSAILHKGQSIIVLPQGIMTYNSGFNKYYKEIQAGDVLVLSVFFPKAPWSAQLAMARNPIIYGLAKEIYVAQSSDKGGTWAGVIDGLRKGREIFVRLPEANEKNANLLLIEKGAKPVDIDGNLIPETQIIEKSETKKEAELLEEKIRQLLVNGELSAAEIIKELKLVISSGKLSHILKGIQGIKIIEKKPLKYSLQDIGTQQELF